MTQQRIEELTMELDGLRRELIRLRGDSPDDCTVYELFPPAAAGQLARLAREFGWELPPSYQVFLGLHNGWRGCWEQWCLVGVETPETRFLHEQVRLHLEDFRSLTDERQVAELREAEKDNPDVLLVTNHPVVGVDFNGSVLVFDRNRPGPGGEFEVAWVKYVNTVEARWSGFEAFLEEAISDTRANVAAGGWAF